MSLRRALLNHHEYASFSRRLFLAIRSLCKLGGVLKTAGTQRVAETVGPTAANASQHGGFATVDPCWDRETDRRSDTVPLHKPSSAYWKVGVVVTVRYVKSAVLFCSVALLDLSVGHTMDVLSPFISILCHSD